MSYPYIKTNINATVGGTLVDIGKLFSNTTTITDLSGNVSLLPFVSLDLSFVYYEVKNDCSLNILNNSSYIPNIYYLAIGGGGGGGYGKSGHGGGGGGGGG